MTAFNLFRPFRRSTGGAPDDQQLLKLYRKSRDTKLILELMRRYEAQILAFGSRYLNREEDIRDFTNEVFLKLSESLKDQQIIHFRSWLVVFLRNRCYDKLRRKKLTRQFLQQTQSFYPEHPDGEIDQGIDQRLLYEALDSLSQKERWCIQALYLEEKSYKEVMDESGWTFNQIRGTRNRAMEKLRERVPVELHLS